MTFKIEVCPQCGEKTTYEDGLYLCFKCKKAWMPIDLDGAEE